MVCRLPTEPILSPLSPWGRGVGGEGCAIGGCIPSPLTPLPQGARGIRTSSGSWSRTNIVSFKARQPTLSRSPNHALKYDILISRILFEAIISLGTYQTVVALLTGWVHLACTLRGRAILRLAAFLCLVKQWCPDFPPARSRSAPAMARDVASRATKKARHLDDAWPLLGTRMRNSVTSANDCPGGGASVGVPIGCRKSY